MPAWQTLLTVHVKTNSKQPRLEVDADGITICVRAPAIDGRANDACVRALAQALSIPNSAVALVSGIRSRQKRLRIRGLTKDECLRRLA